MRDIIYVYNSFRVRQRCNITHNDIIKTNVMCKNVIYMYIYIYIYLI
jgi:hypothetical protein